MNAIRQIVTSDSSGNLLIQVPDDLRQRPVEVIVLPVETSESMNFPLLTGAYAAQNAVKIIRKAQLDQALQQRIVVLQEEAQQKGLTPAELDELLRDDDQ